MMRFFERLGFFWQIVLLVVLCQVIEFGLYKLGVISRYRPLIQVQFSVSTSMQPTDQEQGSGMDKNSSMKQFPWRFDQ